MRDLCSFSAAVFKHWKVLTTGVTLTLLYGVSEHFLQRSLSLRTYLAILSFTTLVAMSLAWRELDRKFNALVERRKKPELQIELTGVWWGENSTTGNLVMTFDLQIMNPLGPPTALRNWIVTLRGINSGKVYRGELLPPTTKDQSMTAGKGVLTLQSETSLAKNASNRPIDIVEWHQDGCLSAL